MESFKVKTNSREELIDITHEVIEIVRRKNVSDGLCCIYTPHTTAGITINENADPTVRSDIIKGLAHLDFESVGFRHMEGNSPAHLKSSIFGCSEIVIVQNNNLQLGTWQGIYFCEFDGPRNRKVFVEVK
ncbi:secondary thiamine-phosphate synthase enzyme YjbQ [Spirochaetota bacterium]